MVEPAPALLVARLRAGLEAAPDTRLGIRDRAIVLLQFAIAGREHEVAHLRLRDVATCRQSSAGPADGMVVRLVGRGPFLRAPAAC